MNDRFRFRVYYEDTKLMGLYNCDGNPMRNLMFPCGGNIMQCTGIKDKNGTLIFEGDIINGTCGIYWGIMIVKFNENEARFCLERIDKKYSYLSFHSKSPKDNFYLEVIGNIYENEDLIKCENQ